MSPFNCFNLPEALARVVLVEWLELEQVVRLDSAFCCRETRGRFVSLAYGQSTTFLVKFDLSDKCLNPLLRWAVAKGARLDSLQFGKGVVSAEESLQLLETFLARSGSAVRQMYSYISSDASYESYQEALSLVAQWCPNVQHFHTNCSLTTLQCDECLIGLTYSCQKLTTLSLYDTKLSEQGFAEALQNCVALEHLKVAAVSQIIPVEAAVPSLKSFIVGSHHISDAVLVAIGQRCVKLETLLIFVLLIPTRRYGDVTDAGVRAVLEGCSLLQKTDLMHVVGISTELRVALTKRCNFTALYLANWHSMSDELAQELLKVSPGLRELHVYPCDWLTDATLAVCAQHCTQLHTLALWAIHHITAEGVRGLVVKLGGKLRSVSLQYCSQLGDEVVLAIAEHCPLLERFVPPMDMSDTAMAKLKQCCVYLKM
jgi:hypothetical protein